MRYFFEISYAGTAYHGWQNQANAIGVQQIVEDVLSKILRKKTAITGSGRTDTGVHCLQQFFHADIDSISDPAGFLIRLNSFLPADIAIRKFFEVGPQAHARYDARARTYIYTISTVKDPFAIGHAWYFFRSVDLQEMNRAAKLLIGTHDFECFSKVKTDVNHFTCSISKAQWKTRKENLFFTITANRFLRGMVRAIVGTLIDVGTGKITVSEFQQVLASRDRRRAGSNVPANGLSLVRVQYSRKIFSGVARPTAAAGI